MGICPQAHMSACEVKALADRVKGALFGLLIGDALSMPTHWFYGGERQVAATYGRITDYVAPTDHLRGSIMSKSNTGGAGRGISRAYTATAEGLAGGFHGDVIGSVVFHGKKEFWKPGADYHYHQGMAAGDNTLEALLARRVINVTGAASGQFDRTTMQQDYIQFMTTPDTHNDTYCGTCHRMFFAKFAAGHPADECPDNDQHNVDAADSIVATIPVALTAYEDAAAALQVAAAVAVTRESPQSQQFAALFADTLRSIVRGASVRAATAKAGQAAGVDVSKQMAADPVTA